MLRPFLEVVRTAEKAQTNRKRLEHLLLMRLDEEEDTLNFSAVTRIVRESRRAGVDQRLLKRMEERLGELAPDIKIYGVVPVCEQCSGLREYLLNKYIIPEATGAADLAREQARLSLTSALSPPLTITQTIT